MSKIDTLPRPDDVSPDLAEFLREVLPDQPRQSIAARVLFKGGTPISQPIAKPGEF